MTFHRSWSVFRSMAALLSLSAAAFSQSGTTTGGPSIASVSENKMSLQQRTFVCGGKTQAGTPIGALAGTEGTITISGIPATATVRQATLFWSVLTPDTESSLPTSTIGESISFDGNPITGTNIGKALETPCFPQSATIAYKADVTAFVASPGNGTYTVSGFPVSGGTSADNFSEGVTLQILWTDPNGALMEDVLYHTGTGGLLAVTQGQLFDQDITGFMTNASGPVTATLYAVIGNGQVDGNEALRFDGPEAGDVNLDNTLDGSTVAVPPASCPSSPVNPPQCFWDDDVHDVSSQMSNSAIQAALTSDSAVTPTNDCFDWVAINLLVSTDEERVCAEGGDYVDAQCPPGAEYKNHGAYLKCVAHAAEEFLAGLPYDGTCPRAEIQSCIVNPRARSDVGKKD